MPVEAGMAPLETWQSLSYDPFYQNTSGCSISFLDCTLGSSMTLCRPYESTCFNSHTASACSGDMLPNPRM